MNNTSPSAAVIQSIHGAASVNSSATCVSPNTYSSTSYMVPTDTTASASFASQRRAGRRMASNFG